MRGLKPCGSCVICRKRSRIFYRCVDWNIVMLPSLNSNRSRIFYRCVDWNQVLAALRKNSYVASFTDAWIETFNPEFDHIGYQSHLLQMRGLKPFTLTRPHNTSFSRIFYRCVDWNLLLCLTLISVIGRIFYRCVDWNQTGINIIKATRVASFTDAWIETMKHGVKRAIVWSHLLQMRGLKQMFRLPLLQKW